MIHNNWKSLSSTDRVRELQKADAIEVFSLVSVGDELHDVLELLPDPASVSMEEEAQLARARGLLKDALNCLTKKQRNVISRRFGLDGSQPETQESIAQSYGVTRNSVFYLQDAGIKRLKEHFANLGIDSSLFS